MNKLTDLNNMLFEQIQKIQNNDLSGESLDVEIKRAGAITSVANTIIANADLALKAQKLSADQGRKVVYDNPLLQAVPQDEGKKL